MSDQENVIEEESDKLESGTISKSLKRSHSVDEDEADDSDEGWIGPMPSEAAPQKKKKVLEHEKIFLENLPCAESYERSYM
jgi:peptidylprolyl isomerase domain and WD repeat-containing protein 1